MQRKIYNILLICLLSLPCLSQPWGGGWGSSSGGSPFTSTVVFSGDPAIQLDIAGETMYFRDGDLFGLNHWVTLNSNGANFAFSDGSTIFFNFSAANGLQFRAATMFLDDNPLRFGNDNDFQIEYNTTSADFEIGDGTNTFIRLVDNGSLSTTNFSGDINVTGQVKRNGTNYNHPDYVFYSDYKLLSLDKLEQYINVHKRLPGIPSAKEVEKDGIDVFESARLNLEKIEELTLHLIELNKRIVELEKKEEEN